MNQLFVYLYPLPLGPPSHPPHPTHLGHHSTELSSLCYTSRFPLAICFTHGSVFMSNLISQFVPPSPCPPCVHMSVLYCSIPVLQIGSSVPFFKIPRICVNIRYLFFSFWLTSLCMTDSKSNHISKMTQFCFFLWLSNIPLYIYVPHLLYPFIYHWTFRLSPCSGYCK